MGRNTTVSTERAAPRAVKVFEGGLPTPIKASVLDNLLGNYVDKKFIIQGLQRGFDLGYEGPVASQACNNNKSANANLKETTAKVASEVEAGRIAGPFDAPPLLNLKCSPLALREKSTPGKFRLLHNLSYPHDSSSVNANIPRAVAKTEYATLDEAVFILNSLDNPFLAKADIAEAFRLLPLAPDNYSLTGFKLCGQYFYDMCMPMGASSACQTFERFSDGIVYILKEKYKVKNIVKVLDDFLFIGDSHRECALALNSFMDLCGLAGIPVASHKTEGPSKALTFLGIFIDVAAGTLSIPKEKITEYSGDIDEMLANPQATLRDLKRVAGKLSFVSRIIPAGRCFIRRIYDAMSGLKAPYQKCMLSEATREDLRLWFTFFDSYNAMELYAPRSAIAFHTHNVFADASDAGYGATIGGHYLYGTFPDSWNSYDIQVRELFPIYLILVIFANELKGKHVTLRSDNSSVVSAINLQTSKNKNLMHLLRKLVLVLLKKNIICRAVHIQGVKNDITDALSRLQIGKATRGLVKLGYRPELIRVPSSLRPHNWQLPQTA